MSRAILKPGDVLSIETGEYSDKWTAGPFNVLKEMEYDNLLQAYKDDQTDDDWLTCSDFITWLMKNGYIEDTPNSHSWYVEDYMSR